MHQKWGDNLLKVCPSIQWSLLYNMNQRAVGGGNEKFIVVVLANKLLTFVQI